MRRRICVRITPTLFETRTRAEARDYLISCCENCSSLKFGPTRHAVQFPFLPEGGALPIAESAAVGKITELPHHAAMMFDHTGGLFRG
jgi:hypothetical protein